MNLNWKCIIGTLKNMRRLKIPNDQKSIFFVSLLFLISTGIAEDVNFGAHLIV